jgi:HEAT repeat protein
MNGRAWLMLALAAVSFLMRPAAVSAGQAKETEKYCAMLHSLDDAERETARVELVKIGKPAMPGLIAALANDPVYLGREGAAFVLGRIRDAGAVKPLIAALGDDYAAVRDQASQALARIGGRTAVDGILEALEGGSNVFLAAAAATLGLLKDPKALPALENLARHKDPDVAAAASEALRRLRSGAR